ncbi:5'/3'-nucleotidase SurE [Actinomycetospora endophytica]|uniref:5'-nucleotidase n=1 Tax=Actinomycetospora endophytica TaxID=2291215 RepID=A0ABS8PHR6_9PSEU|nr:5'/3'-nucleotidase SurE [Actinomycetospora endophytica]MCD2197785.1 5'/3'-nucleotidase SurE [Actinomycetospora endophytica]
MSGSRAATGALLIVVAVVVGALTGCASPAPPPAAGPPSSTAPVSPVAGTTTTVAPRPAPLRILLTDDDGYSAGGIRAVRAALTRAGYDVSTVAPDGNRSGSGAETSGKQTLHNTDDPGVRTVTGTPADAVIAGLAALRAAGRPPDLVVSGTNLGRNTGSGITESGTVGAAVTAAHAGLPAIAVSTDRAEDESDCEPTAAFVVRLVGALATARPPFAPGLVLNVNHPVKQASGLAWLPAQEITLEGDRMKLDSPGDDNDGGLGRGRATIAELDADGKDGAPPSVRDRLAGFG